MKFSWTVLNFFISLEQIKFDQFIEKLNLSGIEIEKLENHLTIKDKTIYLNITTNRKEIFCAVNLAVEISTILNLPMKIKLQPIKLIEPYIVNRDFSYLNFRYIKTHKIYNFTSTISPQWLKNNLKLYDIKPLYLLHDIQKYIYIKWGHKFYIFNLKKLQININTIESTKENVNFIQYINKLIYEKQHNFYFDDEKNFNYKKQIILFFIVYPIDKNNIQNSQDTFNQAYNETINLISTYSKTTIGKSQEYYCDEENEKKPSNILSINKNDIKYLLGPTQNKNNSFLSNQQILDALKQLNYSPEYIHKYKNFKIKIPNYRKHDLERSIDVIEEVGRIHGFERFLSKLPKYYNRGNISLDSLQIKKIRNTLHSIGFYETVTSSFIKKTKWQKHNINICNPLTQDQISLRINIIENLINVYEQNKKNKETNLAIFEVGKIFYKNNLNHFIQENQIGGLITSHQYLQIDWSNPKKSMNWFHAKGIIENFLEIIQANIAWTSSYNVNCLENFQYIKKYYHPNKKIFICNRYNRNLIGMFGEIYQKNQYDNSTQKVYMFEINLNKLLESIDYNHAFNYIVKPYSLYPSVTRDISIKVKNKTNINQIKKIFLKKSISLAKSVEIINEYQNKTKRERSICIRVTYRSNNKTLDNNDLKNIDLNIQDILKIIYCPNISKINRIKSKS